MRLQSVHADDLVLVSIKGRQFYGKVTGIDSGRVLFTPLCPGAGWRSASAREIVAHWRRTGRRSATTASTENGGP
jgi:hypothetical protein